MPAIICQKCGIAFWVPMSRFLRGVVKFCGMVCYMKSRVRHGESKTRLHLVWRSMKNRCVNKTPEIYQYYGERGIAVCQEWRDSYESFRDWSLANGYADGLEIDRRDSTGNYEPNNCRWTTRTEQCQNLRKRSGVCSSIYKGVSFHKLSGKWKVCICVSGKATHRGLFTSEIEAAKEYDRIAKEEFGEFACLNFKNESTERYGCQNA